MTRTMTERAYYVKCIIPFFVLLDLLLILVGVQEFLAPLASFDALGACNFLPRGLT